MNNNYRLSLMAVLGLFASCSSGDPTGGDTHDASVIGNDGGGGDPEFPDSGAVIADASSGSADGGIATSVRFVVMGDTGEGNAAQSEVATAIKNKCDADGCEFAILLGDNIYNAGVDSVNDPQWQTKFEEPYQNLNFPFYPVLGNHDYGGYLGIEPVGTEMGGLGNQWDRGPIEVAYTAVSTKWTLAATHYTLQVANVGFIMLDTNSILWDNTDHGDQAAWYPTALMALTSADWIIGVGHHPYRSNGAHGNAGSYESIEVAGIEIPIPLPIVAGGNVKSFFDDFVCGTLDIYFAGHDHNRQWLDENEACDADLIVSGAGAKIKGFEDRGNAFHFQDATTPGFMYVHIQGNTFTGQFIDKNGMVNYERTFTRQ